MIETAMILAAGRGQRMEEHTLTTPKPLIRIRGRCVIDYALDMVVAHGIKKCVVNVSYLGEQIVDHLSKRTDMEILFSLEPERLETGGGVKKARTLTGDKPIFVLNGDLFWRDGGRLLKIMEEHWNPEEMDVLLSLVPAGKIIGHGTPRRDFDIADGRAVHTPTETAPYLYTGTQILNPAALDKIDGTVFSLLQSYQLAQQEDRLGHVLTRTTFFHVSIPASLAAAEKELVGV